MGRAFEFRKARKMKRWSAMAKAFTRIGKDIAMSVRDGGPNPETNSRLRAVIQNAKAANMPKDNIERAIKRASERCDQNLPQWRLLIPLALGRYLEFALVEGRRLVLAFLRIALDAETCEHRA